MAQTEICMRNLRLSEEEEEGGRESEREGKKRAQKKGKRNVTAEAQ